MKVIVDIKKTELYKETIEFSNVVCRLKSDNPNVLEVILIEKNTSDWRKIRKAIFDYIVEDLQKHDINARFDLRELITIPSGMEFIVKEKNPNLGNIVELSVNSVSRSVRFE